MKGWGDFKTVGQTSKRPAQSRFGEWLSLICLVLFLSLAGTLIVALLARVIPLLILMSVFGWGMLTRQSAQNWSRIQISRGDWGVLILLMIAFWGASYVRGAAVARYGVWPGNLITFGLINLAVGVAVWFYLRGLAKRERAEEARRAARAERLARAQEELASQNSYISDRT